MTGMNIRSGCISLLVPIVEVVDCAESRCKWLLIRQLLDGKKKIRRGGFQRKEGLYILWKLNQCYKIIQGQRPD
jgi:hypothetical protein